MTRTLPLTCYAMFAVLLLLTTAVAGRAEDSFASGPETLVEWQPERGCRLLVRNDTIEITASGDEPLFFRRFEKACGQVDVSFRFRTRAVSNAVVQWITKQSPRRSEDKQVVIPLIADGQWHTYPITMPVFGVLYGVSIRLTAQIGTWDFGTGTLTTTMEPPLFLVRATPASHVENPTLPPPSLMSSPAMTPSSRVEVMESVTPDRLGRARLTFTNTSLEAVTFEPGDLKQGVTLLPGKLVTLQLPTQRVGSIRTASLMLRPNNFAPATHTVFFCDCDETDAKWVSIPLGELAIRTEGGHEEPLFTLDFANDGTVARIRRLGKTIAFFAPLATIDDNVCAFEVGSPQQSAGVTKLKLASPDLQIDWRIEGEQVAATISVPPSSQMVNRTVSPVVTGPRLRLLGPIWRGMLAGIESLGAGDISSSPIDIEPPKHRRRVPRPAWLTMPLAVLASDSANVSTTWDDITLQPSFSSPDYTEDCVAHAVSLSSDHIVKTPMTQIFRIRDAASRAGDPIAEGVAWCIARRGLPEPKLFPRTWEEQRVQCRLGMDKLAGADGVSWSYSSTSGEAKRPYADFLSMAWRLSGSVPNVITIDSGGGDIANESIYFVTRRTAVWKDLQQSLVQNLVAELKDDASDGVFLYRSRFPDVESAAASIGYDAMRLSQMMTQVLVTSDEWLSMRVQRGLNSLKDAPIPRGGFYRDTTLHTPDLLSAATLCHLFTTAYRQSGRDEFLAAAVRFAFHGMAFVYQHGDGSDVPNFATLPMLGASERKFPIWFGVARPQTGLVYADALLDLAEHDATLDWRRIARGIVATAETMQLTDGPYAGCVPSYVELESGRAATQAINPADLAQVRMRCERLPVALSIIVARERRESLVAPFPARWSERGAEVDDAPAAFKFQLLHKGRDVIDAIGSGSGRDKITLE